MCQPPADFVEGSGVKFWNHPDVPRHPTLIELPTPVVPPPPKLTTNKEPDDQFRQITTLWKKAVWCRYGVDVHTFTKARRNPSKSKYYKRIITLAEILIEKEISPASWIGYCFDFWHQTEKHPTTDPPPISWVLGLAIKPKNRGRYYREASAYRGGRLLWTPTYRILLERLKNMRAELTCLPLSATNATIKQVVDKFFPEDTYDKLKSKIRKETEENEEKLEWCLHQGEWLWEDDWEIR